MVETGAASSAQPRVEVEAEEAEDLFSICPFNARVEAEAEEAARQAICPLTMEETQQEEDETRVEESAGDASPSKLARIAGVEHRETEKQQDQKATQSMERRQCQSCSFPATSKTETDCSFRSADTDQWWLTHCCLCCMQSAGVRHGRHCGGAAGTKPWLAQTRG